MDFVIVTAIHISGIKIVESMRAQALFVVLAVILVIGCSKTEEPESGGIISEIGTSNQISNLQAWQIKLKNSMLSSLESYTLSKENIAARTIKEGETLGC